MKRYAPLLVLLAGTCWGAIGIFVRGLNRAGIDSMEIVWLRALTAFIIIGFVTSIYDKNLLRINIRHLWCFLGTAGVGIIFFNLCYFKTIEASSLSVAAVLLYTAPIFVMIFSSFLFKEKITKVKVLAIIMAFSGCVLVSGVLDGTAVLTGKGIVIGIGAGLGYALYTVFNRYALNYGYHPFTIQFYTFLLGIIIGTLFVDFHQINVAIVSGGLPLVLLIVGIGTVSTAIPNLSYTMGLKYLENGNASIMASIEPVMAIIFGIVIFHEIPTLIGFTGIILVIGAMFVVNLGDKR